MKQGKKAKSTPKRKWYTMTELRELTDAELDELVKSFGCSDEKLAQYDHADKRIKYVLQKAEAVGLDGKTYKLEDTDDLYPTGGSICVRACTDGDRSDRYGVDFFV